MANALAQNIDNTQNSTAIDVMMQAVQNTSINTSKRETGFSNIINNLDAKVQKTQTNIEQKTKVSNISTINKKALTNKKTQQSINEKTQSTNSTQKTIDNKSSKEQNTQASNKKFQSNNTSKTESVSIKKETVSVDNSNKLSDINNSSPVESSPVSSFDNEAMNKNEELKIETEELSKEIEVNIEEFINIIPLINEVIKPEIKDINIDTENLAQNSENIENITKLIENISSNLDDSNLNQEEKTQIQKALNKIKTLLNTNDLEEVANEFESLLSNLKEISSDFTAQLSDLKENLKEIFKELEVKTQETLGLNESEKIIKTQENEIIFADKNTNKIEKINENVIQEQKASTENISKDIKEIANKIEKINNEIKTALENQDIEKLNEIKENISQIKEETKTLINENEPNINTDLFEKLETLLKETKKVLNDEIKIENKNIKTEETLNIKTLDSFETLEKLSEKDFENINLKDKKAIKEIVNLLENLENDSQIEKIDKKLTNEIEKLINDIKSNKLSNNELSQAIDSLTDNFKSENEKKNSINIENNQTSNIDLNIAEIDTFSKENEQFGQNQENNFDNKKEIIKKEEITTEEANLDNFNETEYSDEEIKLQRKAIENNEIEDNKIENIEKNLQKTVAMQEMLDEMMVEVDIKTIPSHSGALSVSDEVAKLAMGETNSLNTITSAHGSVTYDASGSGAIIKNAAGLMKSTQTQSAPSMEDILGQVGEKIAQLKDSSVQKLTMVLRPNDLGRLSIELSANQEGLTTQIMAQNDNVRAYIEKNINLLRQQLSDAGVNVNNIQIKTAGQEGSTNYEGNQNFSKEQQEQNLNQQNNNNKDEKNNQQNNDRTAKEILSSISNYDMSFAKDFSSILNKSLKYNFN